MSQNITAIITNQEIQLQKEIVHFVEQGVTIIPLQIEGSPWQMQYFVKKASKYHQLKDFISFLETRNYWSFWLKDDDKSVNVLKDSIELIEALKLHTFFFEYYEEWADIPAGNSFMAVVNGKIVTDPAMNNEGDEHNRKPAYGKLVGLRHNWLANESRYHSYASAKKEYGQFNNI